MKTYGEVDLKIYVFLTSAGVWSASRPGLFTSGERAPGTHWIGGWVGRRIIIIIIIIITLKYSL
jgi:hypothetical protein